jgi:uncharacterized protein YjiS (DUF1127 family)
MNTTTINTTPGLLSAISHVSLSSLASRLHATLVRQQSRKILGRLDAHQLADLGLTRDQALAEAAKPFWNY